MGKNHWSAKGFSPGTSGNGSKRGTDTCHTDLCLFPARDDDEGGVEVFVLVLDGRLVFTKVAWNSRSCVGRCAHVNREELFPICRLWGSRYNSPDT